MEVHPRFYTMSTELDGNNFRGSSQLNSLIDAQMPNTFTVPSSVVDDEVQIQPPEDSTPRISDAATRLQKAYRGHRTRRRLADSAVVAEELWWQAIDYVRLNHSTISFFSLKHESPSSRWNRIGLNASKVGKGLSNDSKAQKLAFQHWIEAIDPQHRYGHNLHLYYDEWCKTNDGEPFFYWLDVGGGKDVDLKECPRSKLRRQCIKYLGPQEREDFEYTVVQGRIVHKESQSFLDTTTGSPGTKWIFVMSTSKKLYAGVKKKGRFHHSSFLAGGATLAAGRLEVANGNLKSISAYSGHYRPTDESLAIFTSFLKDNGVDLEEVEVRKPTDDSDSYDDGIPLGSEGTTETSIVSEGNGSEIPKDESVLTLEESCRSDQPTPRGTYRRSLSGGLRSPRAQVPRTSILERINSKKAAQSYQLGHQLSLKTWSTGAGPRIGCVADYPVEVRQQALEMVNLSPRTPDALRTPLVYKQLSTPLPKVQATSDACC